MLYVREKDYSRVFEVATRPFRSCSWGVLMNGRHFALQISNGRFRAVKQKADLFQHAPQSVSADHILIRVASSKSTSSKYDAVYACRYVQICARARVLVRDHES